MTSSYLSRPASRRAWRAPSRRSSPRSRFHLPGSDCIGRSSMPISTCRRSLRARLVPNAGWQPAWDLAEGMFGARPKPPRAGRTGSSAAALASALWRRPDGRASGSRELEDGWDKPGHDKPRRRSRSIAGRLWGSPDHDPRVGAQPDEEPAEAPGRERDAARGGAKSGAGQMQEDRAAAAGNARARVVIELDEEVVEMVVAPQPVACRVGAELDRPIVAAVARMLAPGVGLTDAAYGEARVRAACAVLTPPQAKEPERAA